MISGNLSDPNTKITIKTIKKISAPLIKREIIRVQI
jgi:hypothetical protein